LTFVDETVYIGKLKSGDMVSWFHALS
jgi:hypothetical protein